MKSYINVRGARTHNLKNISVDIPKNKLIIITGLSGSGKSSLAFDTIYTEGQRRYIESLSSYARQFLGMLEKPDVDSIEGLSPAISIDQKTASHNPRSTVGTVTEIYDYLRVLFARIGVPYCPNDNIPITAQSVDQIIDEILALPLDSRIEILSPIVRDRKGSYQKQLDKYRQQGYINAYINGEKYSLEEDEITLDKNKKHTISLLAGRFIIREPLSEIRSHISDAVERSLEDAGGLLILKIGDEEKIFSSLYSCHICGFALPEMHPRVFSFNLPEGACNDCSGLGYILEPQEELIFDLEKSLNNDACKLIGDLEGSKWYKAYFDALAKQYKFSLDVPLKKLSKNIREILLYGTKENLEVKISGSTSYIEFNKPFEGLIPMIKRRYMETQSESNRQFYKKFMLQTVCTACNGGRLKKELQNVFINKYSITKVTQMPIIESYDWLKSLNISDMEKIVAQKILQEIESRFSFLMAVGLGYLSLSRNADTLSGGEMQRIRLATQIGTKLTGVLYVLDEPSIGLHQKDNDRLIETLLQLQSLDNTLIIVEHDEQMIKTADFIIDMGPGAGVNGGEIMATGSLEDILKNTNSLTSQYLSGKKFIKVPKKLRKGNGQFIELYGVTTNNLKNINIKFPLGKLIAVTGVSGSGKSSLIRETLVPACLKHFKVQEGKDISVYKSIKGLEYIQSLIDIDQSPIGRTPRSNPATYVKVFDYIRELFAQTNQAKIKGYKAGRFSFNVKGGRCEACSGDGVKKIEMHFLSDVYVECDVCYGKRYNKETLEVYYKGKNIHEILHMSISEAYEFFKNHSKVNNILQTLLDVGLDYITLGQSCTTLSGGEAQRIKLSRELAKKTTGKTLYILDEPTTGLHFADTDKLIQVLHRLVDNGNSMIIIEHNLDLIKVADHIIDIGPEGGDAGGYVLAEGTPKDIIKIKKSYTGQYLKELLSI